MKTLLNIIFFFLFLSNLQAQEFFSNIPTDKYGRNILQFKLVNTSNQILSKCSAHGSVMESNYEKRDFDIQFLSFYNCPKNIASPQENVEATYERKLFKVRNGRGVQFRKVNLDTPDRIIFEETYFSDRLFKKVRKKHSIQIEKISDSTYRLTKTSFDKSSESSYIEIFESIEN